MCRSSIDGRHIGMSEGYAVLANLDGCQCRTSIGWLCCCMELAPVRNVCFPRARECHRVHMVRMLGEQRTLQALLTQQHIRVSWIDETRCWRT